MNNTKGTGAALKKQFKRWSAHLLKVNSSYVRNPRYLLEYITGPNWDDPDCEYAHYRDTVSAYGQELLGMFERMIAAYKALGSDRLDEVLSEYRGLLKSCGIEEES